MAAGGLAVPMISGRGLGHTGGTLDKLEAIPGFNTALSLADFRRVLKECGMGLIGQTAEIAPADKKIYALRDATSTVENIGLICASIMSKKLAEGIDALVLDVKTGSGAFMAKEEDAIRLAEVMVDTARRTGKKAVALLTDMNQPLGRMAGHSNEVIEAIDVLKGHGPEDLARSQPGTFRVDVLSRRTHKIRRRRPQPRQEMIASGKALATIPPVHSACKAATNASLTTLPFCPWPASRAMSPAPNLASSPPRVAGDFGVALALLEGGRSKKEDASIMAVGLEFHRRIGDEVKTGEKLVTIQYNSEHKACGGPRIDRFGFEIGDIAATIASLDQPHYWRRVDVSEHANSTETHFRVRQQAAVNGKRGQDGQIHRFAGYGRAGRARLSVFHFPQVHQI